MIKKLSAIISVLMLFIASHQIAFADVNNFVINSFDSEYILSKTDKDVGTVRITEKIEAEFPNFNQNHGIERAIPKTYNKNSLDIKIISVLKKDNSPWQYTTREQNDNLILRIGDANTFVHGPQTYIITYSVSNVITFYDNYDEWFWDVNGDQWSQQTKKVSANIYIDSSLLTNLQKDKKCYTGSFGSTKSDCKISEQKDKNGISIKVTANNSLSAGENLSFVLGFNKNTFKKPPINWFKTILGILIILGAILPPIITLVFILRKWHQTGKDPKGKGLIVPEYKPPKDINPLLASLILSERLETKAISATLINLCVDGYVKIHEIKKDRLIGSKFEYEFELTKNTSNLPEEIQKVVKMIFDTNSVGTKINISLQKNKLYSKLPDLTKTLNEKIHTLGYFISDPSKARNKYNTIGALMFVGGGILMVVLGPLAIGLIISGIIIFFVSSAMPARTAKGVSAKEHLLGLKDYMNLAEADRIKTLQSPKGAEKTPVDTNDKKQLLKIYENLLPYAILFGIEKEWAKNMEHLYQQPPDWYSGSRAFSASHLATSLNSVSSATTNSFTAPSSSGSSGFSGGSSGGGGGGGGGGGW
jgi:uncharacterized membrane protein